MTTASTGSDQLLTARSFRAIGTTATVVVQDPAMAEIAERELAAELASIDVGVQPLPRRLRAAARAPRIGASCAGQ